MRNVILVIFAVISISVRTGVAESKPWNLPRSLSADNATVTFEVGTTWHTVHGVAKKVLGRVWLQNSKDFNSVMAEVTLPVEELDTDNSSRDKELRSSMESDKFRDIKVEITRISELCDPTKMVIDQPCIAQALTNLTIRDITKSLAIPIDVVRHKDNSYTVDGKVKIQWPDFGVKDPSIFIARVHSSVTVSLHVTLAP